MKGRKLEAWEAIKLLDNGGTILNEDGADYNQFCEITINYFMNATWYEYLPEPKTLAERFEESFQVDDNNRVLHWLSQQPENSLSNLLERFEKRFSIDGWQYYNREEVLTWLKKELGVK